MHEFRLIAYRRLPEFETFSHWCPALGPWLEEARALRGRTLSDTAAQAIGYAELFAHLDGTLSWDDTVERIVIRTRQFASKQRRWFRKDPRITWLSADDVPAAVEAAARLV